MKNKDIIYKTALFSLAGVALLLMNSCVSIPDGVEAVKPFELDRYLGKWYEIARMDFKYEKGLNNVTAEYSLREDGKIKVDNRGYDYAKKEWRQSIGKAKPVGDPSEARLKVSFFGPFYSGYNVIAIDKDYQYALIMGDNTKYMWILSRSTVIPEEIKRDYLEIAKQAGYKTEELIWPEHTLAK